MDAHQEAREVAARAQGLEPEIETWGMESYGDASGVMGGGVGGFLWFESREELFDFVGRLLAYLSPWAQRLDTEDMARGAAAVVAQVESGELDIQEGMEALNHILSGSTQLRWWGQLKDLLDADDEFAREVARTRRRQRRHLAHRER